MRHEDQRVDHDLRARELVWDYVTDPSNYLHFMSGVTRWEVEGEQRSGLGARYRMLMRVGSAEVGGLVEIVEFAEAATWPGRRSPASTSAAAGGCARPAEGRTKVEFRFAYGVAGAGITGYRLRARRRARDRRATCAGRSTS